MWIWYSINDSVSNFTCWLKCEIRRRKLAKLLVRCVRQALDMPSSTICLWLQCDIINLEIWLTCRLEVRCSFSVSDLKQEVTVYSFRVNGLVCYCSKRLMLLATTDTGNCDIRGILHTLVLHLSKDHILNIELSMKWLNTFATAERFWYYRYIDAQLINQYMLQCQWMKLYYSYLWGKMRIEGTVLTVYCHGKLLVDTSSLQEKNQTY